MNIGISFGCLYPSIEEQLDKQGFTIKNAEKHEKCRNAIHQLVFSNILTDSQSKQCFQKLMKQITKCVEPIKK